MSAAKAKKAVTKATVVSKSIVVSLDDDKEIKPVETKEVKEVKEFTELLDKKKVIKPTAEIKPAASISTPATKEDIDEVKSMIKDLKKELKGLIEIQQRLIHERLGVAAPPPPKEYGEEPSSKNKIEIVDSGKNRIRVSGNTFTVKDTIKDSGECKWEGGTKLWSLPS